MTGFDHCSSHSSTKVLYCCAPIQMLEGLLQMCSALCRPGEVAYIGLQLYLVGMADLGHVTGMDERICSARAHNLTLHQSICPSTVFKPGPRSCKHTQMEFCPYYNLTDLHWQKLPSCMSVHLSSYHLFCSHQMHGITDVVTGLLQISDIVLKCQKCVSPLRMCP